MVEKIAQLAGRWVVMSECFKMVDIHDQSDLETIPHAQPTVSEADPQTVNSFYDALWANRSFGRKALWSA